MYSIEIRTKAGEVLQRAEGMGDARLIYRQAYQEGDSIVFTSDEAHAALCVDQCVEPAMVLLPGKRCSFLVPFGDAKNGYAPGAFEGGMHALWIRPAPEEARRARRNIAHNPAAQRAFAGCYPHASANVETRDEAQFWARNAIDGHRFNTRHGGWPYHSWGIGERRDAWLQVDFGRVVRIDEVALVLRADFPHDAWWERGTIECSDGFTADLPLVKTTELQRFPIGKREVTWVRLFDLIKADDPSPYPALTQLEIYGRDID